MVPPYTGSTVCLLLRTFLSKSQYSGHAPPECDICGQTGHITKIVTGLASTCFARVSGISNVIARKRILGLRGLTAAQGLLLVVPRRGRRCGHSR